MIRKLLYIVLATTVVVSCTDLTELNTNSKSPTEVPAGSLIANAVKEMTDRMTSTNVNYNNLRLWSQQWTQTTYVDESNYQLVERNVNGRAFDLTYATVVRDLEEARAIIEADAIMLEADKKNQLAVIEVMEVYAYHVAVDLFGSVPYSEALSGTVTPKYDDGKTIYMDIISRLDAAIADLSGDNGLGAYDIIYNGNADAWKMFANSLKLRLACRIADVDAAKAKSMASSAVSGGVFAAQSDGFMLNYLATTPNNNPVWEDLVQSGRSDFVAGETFGDKLNELMDPRRNDFFKNLGGADTVIGGTIGAANSYPEHSQPSALVEDPTRPGVLLNYAEVEFLLAEAVERGLISGTAEDHYNAGVTASILEWGGTEDEATTYLAQASVAYSTAGADWKETIATQKWIAMYNRGFEAWSTYRLLDAPTLVNAAQAGTTPPTRYTFPVDEYSLNKDNVEAAAAALENGDVPMSRVFWDQN